MRIYFLLLISLAILGCASTAAQKSQRDRDVEQCTYGAVVPHNFDSAREREAFIQHEAVPGCMRAKGYTDVAGAE